MGLHDAYANIRDQIMLIDPFPSLNKVFSYLQQQERQCQIASNNSSVDSVALLAKRGNENYKPTLKFAGNGKRDKPYCSHYKITGNVFNNCFKAENVEPPVCFHYEMTGHTVEKCYRLHRYPFNTPTL